MSSPHSASWLGSAALSWPASPAHTAAHLHTSCWTVWAVCAGQRADCRAALVQQGLIGPLLMGDLARKGSHDMSAEPRLSSSGLKSLSASIRQAPPAGCPGLLTDCCTGCCAHLTEAWPASLSCRGCSAGRSLTGPVQQAGGAQGLQAAGCCHVGRREERATRAHLPGPHPAGVLRAQHAGGCVFQFLRASCAPCWLACRPAAGQGHGQPGSSRRRHGAEGGGGGGMQGVVGSTPWNALVFGTLWCAAALSVCAEPAAWTPVMLHGCWGALWKSLVSRSRSHVRRLQLLGFSDLTASSLMAIFAFGCALGAFAGGWLGAGLGLWPAAPLLLPAGSPLLGAVCGRTGARPAAAHGHPGVRPSS